MNILKDAMNKTKKKVQIISTPTTKTQKVKKPNSVRIRPTRVNTISQRSRVKILQKKSTDKNEHDQVPVKEPKQNSNFACSTCIEARSRSVSKSPAQSPDKEQNINLSTTSPSVSVNSSSSCDERYYRNKNLSISPIRIEPSSPMNRTYTMSNRSKSFDSFLRESHSPCPRYRPTGRSNSHDQRFHRSLSPPLIKFLPVHCAAIANSDHLVKKLVETEISANEIARQLSLLKDFLKIELINPQKYLNPLNVKHLENERNRLLDHLNAFEFLNHDLKKTILDVTNSATSGDLRRMQENDELVKHIDALEHENHVCD